MTTYYEYHPSYFDWTGISTVSSGYATSEYTPVSVGAGLTQTWTGSGWSTTTNYSGIFYYTTDQYGGIGLGQSYYSYATNAQPSIAIGTATAPPAISTTGYSLGWDGSDWTVSAENILPGSDGVVSLGSSTNKYKDIFVSEGTVYLGVHSLSVASNNLEYDGTQIITGVGGTIDTTVITTDSITAGIVTATQIGSPGSGTLGLDGDLLPLDNREQDLGHSTKSWRKVYVKSGPKAIEFEGTGVGFGLTVNAQLENIFEFDGHELFLGDGDIGHHGNLVNVYATGIVSATSFKVTSGPTWTSGTGTPEASVTAPVGSLYTRTDGGASTTLYVKESGTGNTGWVAK